MPKRKTFSIAQLVADVNRKNRLSTCEPEVRQGWNSLLEGILHAADQYAGFGYLEGEDLPAGQKPGIAFHDKEGNEITKGVYFQSSVKGHTQTFPDESRRFYYVNPSLSKAFHDIVISEEHRAYFR